MNIMARDMPVPARDLPDDAAGRPTRDREAARGGIAGRAGYSLLGALSIGTGLVMITLIVILIGAVFSSVFRVQDATEWSRRSQRASRDLHELLMLVTAAESSQRGFLLTGDLAFLEPYSQAQHDMEIDFSRLNQAAVGDAALLRKLRQAETLIRAKFAEMQAAIDQAQSSRPDQVQAMLRSSRARELTQTIKQLDTTAYLDESNLSGSWQAEQERWQRRALRIVAAIALLAVLLVVTAVCVVMLYLAQRTRMEREMLQAHDQAVEANRAKSRFLAAASHDLRQPLHALNLLLRTLERRIGNSKDTELVQSARSAATSMAHMFDGLLSISRLDAGVVEPKPESFLLSEVLAELRAGHAAAAAAKRLAFDVDCAAITLTTDRALLTTMLGHLLANAISYTAEGSVTVLARDTADGVVIEVCDTGRGIPAEEQERVFDEFHRLEHVQVGQGLGLGLSMVRRLAQLLNIAVKLRSQPGQGSVFSLVVPHHATAALQAARPGQRPDVSVDLRGKTVLLVDDEPLNREAMRCEMGDWGMRVVLAADAEEALHFLASRNIAIDVAIVDRDLGSQISGPELLDRLATELGIAVPAIVVTGATDSDALQDLEETGYAYLIKPVDEITLRRALNEVMAAEPVSDLID